MESTAGSASEKWDGRSTPGPHYSLLPEHALLAVPVYAYSETPTRSTNHRLLVAPTVPSKTDNQDKANVPHHGQTYDGPIEGYDRGCDNGMV